MVIGQSLVKKVLKLFLKLSAAELKFVNVINSVQLDFVRSATENSEATSKIYEKDDGSATLKSSKGYKPTFCVALLLRR